MRCCSFQVAHRESTVAEKAWGGVFAEATDRRVEQFTESVSFDRRLYAHDIAGSIAHAQMLAQTGLITPAECQQIEQGLSAIRHDIEQGRFQFAVELEDIHMHIERALIDRIGDTGRKLHTARSRNDQVATDMRLWVRDSIDEVDDRVQQLQRALVGRCDCDFDVILPGYTHMQRAQPVLAPHYWLAYCEKLERDRQRLADCRRRANVSSLGAAALAGTSLPIDRDDVARRLAFDGVAANSLDVSSDRDFLVEFAFVLALIAEHLSTWAEEWILWSTTEFNFLKLPQAFCTGSSIMPQKVNPDVLELIRGKTGRVVGNLQALLVLMKGLPLAYNRDLQEDKQRLFDSFDTVVASLELAAPLVAGAELNRSAIAERLDRGYLDATTFMEYLIRRGIPQRTAHGIVGGLVRLAMERNCRLSDLPLDEFRAADPGLDQSVYEVLGVERAVASFQSYGSTGPQQVRYQIDSWKKRLEAPEPECNRP
ncbi:MAG: argininosuccinate lyase [Thermoguttaceae bacterium]|nr:argininosuccinate lyase [Thermoguttaceae bacterium]